jgi:hypothetical protein
MMQGVILLLPLVVMFGLVLTHESHGSLSRAMKHRNVYALSVSFAADLHICCFHIEVLLACNFERIARVVSHDGETSPATGARTTLRGSKRRAQSQETP